MKETPIFKLIDKVWHLTKLEDLKIGDTIRIFYTCGNSTEGAAIDFNELPVLRVASSPKKGGTLDLVRVDA